MRSYFNRFDGKQPRMNPSSERAELRKARDASKAMLKFIRDIDSSLKKGHDNAVIVLLEKEIPIQNQTVRTCNLTRFSDGLDRLNQRGFGDQVREFGVKQLKQCLDYVPDLYADLCRKKAFILLAAVGGEALSDPQKANDVSIALQRLSVHEEARPAVINLTKQLAEQMRLRQSGLLIAERGPDGEITTREATDEETNSTWSYLDAYTWWLERFGYDKKKIEIEANKLNGKRFDKWVKEIQQALIPQKSQPARSNFEAQQAKRQKGKRSKGTQGGNGNNNDKTNDTQGTNTNFSAPRELSENERDKLAIEKAALVLQHPTASYEEMVGRVLVELNKVQAFKTLDYDEEKLQELLIKLGLTKEAYELIQTYRELAKSQKNGVTLGELGEVLGNPKALDQTIEAVNNAGFAEIQIASHELVTKDDVLRKQSSNPIVGIDIPLFNTIEAKYGQGQGFPSRHEVATCYLRIGDKAVRTSWHDIYRRFNTDHLLFVELTYADGTSLKETITSAEGRAIITDIEKDGNSHVDLSRYSREGD